MGSIKKKTIHRYSKNFKQKVIQEIESGELTQSQVRLKYDIRGGGTIPNWIKKLGKNDLLCKKVRIEMPEEINQILLLKKRISELENPDSYRDSTNPIREIIGTSLFNTSL